MFTDIPLPVGVTMNPDDSQVYQTIQGRVGQMVAVGRVKGSVVIDYFRQSMLKNGWTRDSEFNTGENRMLIFSKKPRSAALIITETWISTKVEVNVSIRRP